MVQLVLGGNLRYTEKQPVIYLLTSCRYGTDPALVQLSLNCRQLMEIRLFVQASQTSLDQTIPSVWLG